MSGVGDGAAAGVRGRPARRTLLCTNGWTLALLVAVLVASLLLPLIGGTEVRICPFLLITGLPCPGCGLGRSFCALSRGELLLGLRYHLLGPVAYGGLLLVLGKGTLEIVLARRLAWPHLLRRLSRPLCLLTLCVLVAAWVLRLTGVWPLPR